MNTFVNVAVAALAGASMVAADAGCVSLQEAVTQNGLNKLGEAVITAATGGGTSEDLSTSTALLLSLAQGTVEVDEEDKVTIFAPEDDAWPATLPEGEELLRILLGHVVEGYYTSEGVATAFADADPTTGITLPTLAPGVEVSATMDGLDVFVAATDQAPPGAMVIMPDIETCVGVIHVVDTLLMAGAEAMAPAMAPATTAGAPLPTVAGGPAAAGGVGDAAADTGLGAGAPVGALDADAPVGVGGTRDIDFGTDADTTDGAPTGAEGETDDAEVETDDTTSASVTLVGSVLSAVVAAVALLA